MKKNIPLFSFGALVSAIVLGACGGGSGGDIVAPIATHTPVSGATNTNTPVPTATNTNTPIPTATNTNTPVPTATNTNTPVPTATNTNTPVPTATNTNTPVPTTTDTATPVPTATNTNTPVPTATNTNTPVPTATNTNTPAPTATNTNTPVPTATNTNTPVPTATNTNTPVPTATNTNTPIPTSTVTNTPTPTATPISMTVAYRKFTTGTADASPTINVTATFTQSGTNKSLIFQGAETLQLQTPDDFNQVSFSGVSPFSKGLTRFADAKLIAYCPNDSVERFAAVYIDTNSLIAFDASTPAGRQEMVGKTFRFTNCQNPNFVYPSDSFTFNADGTATDIFDDDGTPVTETLSVADLNAVFGATGFTDSGGQNYMTAYRYQRPDNGYDYVLLNKQVQAGVANFLLVLPN